MIISSLRAAGSVVSPPGRPYVDDPSMLAFFRDLVEPFGEVVEEKLLSSGPNVSHRDLVGHLVAAEEVRNSRPDLIVLAYALPDVHPFTAVAPHLNMLLGGQATSFGISQQGPAAPFTALRIVAGFQRAGRCREAVVAVLEQTTLPTRHPLVHDTPLVDSGVILILGPDGGPRLGGVETVESGEAMERRLGELAAPDPAGTLVVRGPWLDDLHDEDVGDGVPTHRIGPGTYCTSVWLALARHWRSWRRKYGTVVLCDADPQSGRGHLAVMSGE
jgi:hypothetical protein